jgi:xylulokinase
MPRLVESIAPSGTLRPALAGRWGMGGSVTVAGGAGDNAATAIGAGTVTTGSGFVSLGTSGVLLAANERYLPNPVSAAHCFCHALADTWHQMGVILSRCARLRRLP